MFGNKEKDRNYEPPKAAAATPATVTPKPATPVTPAATTTPAAAAPVVAHKDRTVIGPGAKFTGHLEIEGSLEVNGEVEGTITCSETLVVGPQGKLKAEIEVRDATISGRVEGKIEARERVELAVGSHFIGDVHSKSFMIQDGVFFEGNCSMGETRKKNDDAKGNKDDKSEKPEMGIIKQA